MDGHPPPGIQIQAMPHKVGNVTFTFNVSLFLFYCWSVIFFPFCLTVFLRQISLLPQTQDVRIGKIIHCYLVRMRNPPSVVWLDRIGNMALVVQITRHFQIMKLGTSISQNCTEDRAWRYVCSFRNQFYYYRILLFPWWSD